MGRETIKNNWTPSDPVGATDLNNIGDNLLYILDENTVFSGNKTFSDDIIGQTVFNDNSTLQVTSYRPTNVVTAGSGYNFDLNNEILTQKTYARILGRIESNVNGAESGDITFDSLKSGVMTRHVVIGSDSNINIEGGLVANSTISTQGTIIAGLGATTGIGRVRIAPGRSGDGDSYIDFISDTTYSEYGLRVIRQAGANGKTLLDHRGTGDLEFLRQEAGDFIFNGGKITVNNAIEATSTISTQGTIIAGLGATTGIGRVRIAPGRSGDGDSYIDFISDTTYSEYGLRVIRQAGANGKTLLDHRGTGDLEFLRQETGSFVFNGADAKFNGNILPTTTPTEETITRTTTGTTLLPRGIYFGQVEVEVTTQGTSGEIAAELEMKNIDGSWQTVYNSTSTDFNSIIRVFSPLVGAYIGRTWQTPMISSGNEYRLKATFGTGFIGEARIKLMKF